VTTLPLPSHALTLQPGCWVLWWVLGALSWTFGFDIRLVGDQCALSFPRTLSLTLSLTLTFTLTLTLTLSRESEGESESKNEIERG
jgi:hypothetical protein